MRKIIAISALALFLSCVPALADEVCQLPWDRQAAFMKQSGYDFTEMPAEARLNFQAYYNADEPKTDYVFDHIFVTSMPNGDYFVVLVIQGCVFDAGGMTQKTLDTFMTNGGHKA